MGSGAAHKKGVGGVVRDGGEHGEEVGHESGNVGGRGITQMTNVEDAIKAGWAVGVCGWQRREEQAVSDGTGGTREETRVCDFITEFVAPGGGYGRAGAGTELLGEVKRRCVSRGGREIHGHVWKEK